MNAVRRKIDLDRLAKILALADSPYDHEALAAARRAAKILREADLTYQELFNEYIPSIKRIAQLGGISADIETQNTIIAQLKREISQLRSGGRSTAQQSSNGTELYRWRKQLLDEKPLMSSERRALSEITAIAPKSKEEFYVRWLARRYQLTS